jgi:hypothetical protein
MKLFLFCAVNRLLYDSAPATAIPWYDLYNKHDLVFLLLVNTEVWSACYIIKP